MATPRCMRAFLGPARRIKTIEAPRLCSRTFSRAKSYETDEDGRRKREPRYETDDAALEEIKAEMWTGETPFDQRLTDMGLDPVEYKKLWRSKQISDQQMAEWEPKTREEAQQRWKELQNTPDSLNLLEMYKQAGVEPIKEAKKRGITLPTDKPPLDPETQAALSELRSPINVKAVNLRPLRRTPEHGVAVCDLQLRTYSIRNLMLFADFAVRAAYYMGLCARGPVPLPKITERWTVPRANFIFKKSQENFERITMRRLIQIQDGHPDVVKAWLAFLQKHQYWGVGMKANIWEYESLDTALRAGYEIKAGDHSRRREGAVLQKVEEILASKGYKVAMDEHRNMEKNKNAVEFRP